MLNDDFYVSSLLNLSEAARRTINVLCPDYQSFLTYVVDGNFQDGNDVLGREVIEELTFFSIQILSQLAEGCNRESIATNYILLLQSLSVRAYNVLRSQVDNPTNIKGSIEFFMSSRFQMQKLRGCGRSTWDELLEFSKKVKNLVVTIGNDLDESQIKAITSSNLKGLTIDELNQKYFYLVDKLSVRSQNIIRDNVKSLYNFNVVHDFLRSNIYVLNKIKNCGRKTHDELREFLFELDMILEQFSLGKSPDVPLIDLYFKNSTPLKTEALQKLFKQGMDSLSKDNKKIVGKFLKNYIDAMSVDVQKLPLNYSNRSLLDNFSRSFRETAQQLLLFDDYDIKYNELQINNSFLSNEDLCFIKDFDKKNNCLPMFFMVEKFLQKTTNKADYLFSLYCGILGEKKTKKEIADIIHKGENVVNSILKDKSRYRLLREPFMNAQYWEHYDFLNNDFLCEEAIRFDELKQNERLNFDFEAFCHICGLVADYVPFVFYIKKDGKPILVKSNNEKYIQSFSYALKSFIFNFDFWYVLSRVLYPQLVKKRKEQIEISISAFVNNSDYWTDKRNEKDIAVFFKKILFDYTAATKNLLHSVIKGEEILLCANVLNIKKVLYEILKNQGTPMKVDDLFTEFKSLYPNHKYTDSKCIRPFLTDKSLFVPIGKKSLYQLADTCSYSGTINELVEFLLHRSSHPMPILELCSAVLQYRPDTTEKSICSIVSMNDNVIQYEGNYVGLKSLSHIYDSQFIEICKKNVLSFEERVEEYKKFILLHDRVPFCRNMEEKESAMAHWYLRAHQVNRLSESQWNTLKQLDEFIEINHYPRTKNELEFKKNLEKYVLFYKNKFRLISEEDDSQLYKWMKRQVGLETSLEGNKRYYWFQFKEFLNNFGFNVSDI